MSRPYLKIALIMCCIIQSIWLHATNIPSQRFRIKALTQEHGLSHNHIFAIEQDQDGFIWFGTADGLNRYDGYDFVTYRNNQMDSTSLSDNFVHTILNDSQDILWIGTISRGLNKFDKKSNTFLRYNANSKKHAISNNVCLSLLEDRNKNIWVGTENGLNKIPANKSEVVHFLYDTSSNVDYHQEGMLKLFIDSDERLWIGTRGSVYYIEDFYRKEKSNNLEFSDKNYLTSGEFRDIYEDKAGRIWLAGLRGVFYYSPSENKLVKLLDGEFYSIISNDENSILAGGGSDLYKISIKDFSYEINNEFSSFNADENPVRHLFKDHSNVIWIAMRGFGLAKTNQQKNFAHYSNDKNNTNRLGGKIVRAITQDSEGYIWVSNTNFGLNRLDPKTDQIKTLPYPSHFPTENVYALHGDQYGNIWAGIRKTETIGLIKYDTKTGTITEYNHSAIDNPAVSNNHVREIFEDSRGLFWLGLDEGLEVFDPKTEEFIAYFSSSDKKNGLIGSSIQSGAIAEDEKGNIWVGSWSGLTKITIKSVADFDNASFEHFAHIPGMNSLSDNRIINLHYSNNLLWIGTYGGGLISYNPKTGLFKNFTTENGLANNVVHGIEKDNNGMLWLSTNLGLSRFNPYSEVFKNFYKFDGLQHNQFYWGASFKDNSNRLYFGGINGLTAFYPDQILYDTVAPKVVFTQLSIFDKPIQVGEEINNKVILTENINLQKEITLSYKEKIFSISFSVLHYVEPSKNQFSYKLEGFNDDWIIVESGRRIVTYTNLPSGEYTFKIRGANYNHKWSDSIRELRIIVHPPYWKSWWFITSEGIFLTFMIIMIYRIRLKKLKHQKRELEHLVKKRTTQLEAKNIELESHHERLEKLVDERTKDLIIAKNKAEESDRLKTAFLANMSHEIRTPLNAIVGFSSLLTNEDNSELKKDEFKSAINNSTEDLLHLIDDIIDLSRIESNDLSISKTSCDINQLLFALSPMIESLLHRSNKTDSIKYKLHVGKSNLNILTDENRLKQILVNLLTNAIKFTSNGEIEFGYKLTETITTDEPKGDNIEFYVKDSGMGISPELQKDIFKRFVKSHESSQNIYRGAGLGLPITKSLVELLGGKIWVKSSAGIGTSFYFTIPFEPAEPEAGKAILIPEEGKKLTDINWSNRNILVAEDEDSNFNYLAELLHHTKAKIERAVNGNDAITKFMNQKYDLVLMDIRMPVMDGYEATNRIKNIAPAIPVIAITAYGMPEEKERCKIAGCDDYISKPFVESDLIKINNYLSKVIG